MQAGHTTVLAGWWGRGRHPLESVLDYRQWSGKWEEECEKFKKRRE